MNCFWVVNRYELSDEIENLGKESFCPHRAVRSALAGSIRQDIDIELVRRLGLAYLKVMPKRSAFCHKRVEV